MRCALEELEDDIKDLEGQANGFVAEAIDVKGSLGLQGPQGVLAGLRVASLLGQGACLMRAGRPHSELHSHLI